MVAAGWAGASRAGHQADHQEPRGGREDRSYSTGRGRPAGSQGPEGTSRAGEGIGTGEEELGPKGRLTEEACPCWHRIQEQVPGQVPGRVLGRVLPCPREGPAVVDRERLHSRDEDEPRSRQKDVSLMLSPRGPDAI